MIGVVLYLGHLLQTWEHSNCTRNANMHMLLAFLLIFSHSLSLEQQSPSLGAMAFYVSEWWKRLGQKQCDADFFHCRCITPLHIVLTQARGTYNGAILEALWDGRRYPCGQGGLNFRVGQGGTTLVAPPQWYFLYSSFTTAICPLL